MIQRLKTALHSLDGSIAHLRQERRVLVELRTPVHRAILGPVADAIREWPGVQVTYTSEYPDRIRPLVGGDRFQTHRQVEWTRFDLYLNADPWAAARLRRCAWRINFFHGVAGKYDLDRPTGLPMSFGIYDRVAFINEDRLRRYVDAGIVASEKAVLVGYPKLDRLATGRVDGRAVRQTLGLETKRPTAFYGPTYSPASSLHQAGEDIIRALADAGFNVIVKLHDRSLDPDPRYTGGINWRARIQSVEKAGRIRYVEGSDSAPYLAAADLMVTDHSSVGFEYLVLDRPLIVFDVPGLAEAARINPEKIALLRTAATVVRTTDELRASAVRVLDERRALSVERQRVAREMFHEPGSATERAVALIRELLLASRPAGLLHPAVDAKPLGEAS